jgi:hypothetical protein
LRPIRPANASSQAVKAGARLLRYASHCAAAKSSAHEAVAGARDLADMVGLARSVASLRGLLTASPPEIG